MESDTIEFKFYDTSFDSRRIQRAKRALLTAGAMLKIFDQPGASQCVVEAMKTLVKECRAELIEALQCEPDEIEATDTQTADV